MRMLASIVSLPTLCMSMLVASHGQNDPKTLIKTRLAASVVSVTSYDSSGNVLARGAGFFVSEAGDVLTTGSLVPSEAVRTEIRTPDGKSHLVKGVAARDEKTDLITVSLENPLSNATPLPSSTFSPEFGEHVFSVNSDINGMRKVLEGVITDISRVSATRDFRVAASVQSILTGTPVINARGEVAGVVIGANETGQGFVARVLSTEASLYPRGAGFQPIGNIKENLPSGAVRRAQSLFQGTAITRVAPAYPAVAKAEGVEGTVVVEVLVGEDGSVLSARPLRSTFRRPAANSEEVSAAAAEALKQAAVDAVRQWRFAPSTLDGKPVKIKGTLTVNFHL